MLQTVELGLSPVVTVFVTSSNATSERRFDKSLTIASLKERLEPITGVPAGTMKLRLMSGNDQLVAALEDDERMLGFYPVQDYMRIDVVDTSPFKINDYSDVSKVEKLEMDDSDYDKLRGTVRDFKRRNKIGRFSDSRSEESEAARLENEFEAEASAIKVGDRCKVEAESGLEKRGTVRYVGKPGFKPGYWVGIEYDEPVGKHDGTVQGQRYFESRPQHGAFLRPNKVVVGNYPELDPFEEDEF